MMHMQNRIRWGIWALPVSGLLSTIAALIPGAGIDPSTNPDGFAQASGNVGMSNLLGITATAFLLVGVMMLYLFLARTSVDSLAFAGFLLIMVGSVLFLSFIEIY